jgi:cellulose synthase/poly-beta-1,6-N-acetylglucosamine synthase-like glycosyltransferase
MTTRQERGFPVNVYIQDVTVIEDTESTIDLIKNGWQLYSYPDILSYSATPKDFGALCIQRQRWANGGLIVLPKLIQFLTSQPSSYRVFIEAFLRIHYLVSPVLYFAMLFLLLVPFKQEQVIILSASLILFIPYYCLYLRDLKYMNYRKRDLISIFALTLILLPINLSGVYLSVKQLFTGQHTLFRRTPKVQYTTPVPLLFIVIEYCLCIYSISAFFNSLHVQEWLSAAYSLLNFVFYIYGIHCLIQYYPRDLLKDFWQFVKVKY